MKNKLTKYIYLIISVALLSLNSCKNDINGIVEKDSKKIQKTNDSLFFQEYAFSDSIKLYSNDSTFVIIRISSDKKEVLQNHLENKIYSLTIFNGYEDNTKLKSDNISNLKSNLEIPSLDNCQKIRIEIISTSNNIGDYNIKCKQRITTDKANGGMQKVTVFPTATYYEYTSDVHDTYMSVKWIGVLGDGDYSTLFKWGYRDCWLFCGWNSIGWYTAYFGVGGNINVNPWSDNGDRYAGRKYELAFGVLTHCIENFELRHQTSPIVW